MSLKSTLNVGLLSSVLCTYLNQFIVESQTERVTIQNSLYLPQGVHCRQSVWAVFYSCCHWSTLNVELLSKIFCTYLNVFIADSQFERYSTQDVTDVHAERRVTIQYSLYLPQCVHWRQPVWTVFYPGYHWRPRWTSGDYPEFSVPTSSCSLATASLSGVLPRISLKYTLNVRHLSRLLCTYLNVFIADSQSERCSTQNITEVRAERRITIQGSLCPPQLVHWRQPVWAVLYVVYHWRPRWTLCFCQVFSEPSSRCLLPKASLSSVLSRISLEYKLNVGLLSKTLCTYLNVFIADSQSEQCSILDVTGPRWTSGCYPIFFVPTSRCSLPTGSLSGVLPRMPLKSTLNVGLLFSFLCTYLNVFNADSQSERCSTQDVTEVHAERWVSIQTSLYLPQDVHCPQAVWAVFYSGFHWIPCWTSCYYPELSVPTSRCSFPTVSLSGVLFLMSLVDAERRVAIQYCLYLSQCVHCWQPVWAVFYQGCH